MNPFRELIVEVAEDLANYGLGVYSTPTPALRTIFTGELPETVVEATLMVDVPSPPPEQYIDTEYLIIDFWCRSPHTDRAKDQARQIYNLYNRRYDWTTTNWHVYWSRALGGIVDADRDVEGSKMFRLSIQFLCRNLTNVS